MIEAIQEKRPPASAAVAPAEDLSASVFSLFINKPFLKNEVWVPRSKLISSEVKCKTQRVLLPPGSGSTSIYGLPARQMNRILSQLPVSISSTRYRTGNSAKRSLSSISEFALPGFVLASFSASLSIITVRRHVASFAEPPLCEDGSHQEDKA